MNSLDQYNKIKYAGGKYWAVYLPNHPDALSDGYVYEHRLIASKIIGRNLLKTEYVHHKDGNGLNNSPENLMVFASNADHIAFHHGANIYKKNGIYYAEEFISKNLYYCIDCGEKILYKSQRCKKCASLKKSNSIIKPERNILKEQIRHNSFIQLGKIYGVTDNAVRKWCKSYNLPYKSSIIKNISDQDWYFV